VDLAGCSGDKNDPPGSSEAASSSASSSSGSGGGSGGSGGGVGGGGGGGVGGGGGSGGGGVGGSGGSGGVGGSGGGGGGAVSTPTRPQLTSDEAADFTVLKYLEKAGTLGALVADNWNPTAGLGDAASFKPTYTVAASGGTHTTVQSAIDGAVAAGGADRIYIKVMPGEYREVVCVPVGAPPITLYGTEADASKTLIVYDNYAGKPKAVGESANPCNANLSGSTFGTSGSATFAAYSAGFQAKNITFSNDTDESKIGGGRQAVALMTQGDKQIYENVRLLGNQDTFYAKTANTDTAARVYVKASYVEGDVDFIFGRATIVLDGCTIKYLSAQKSSSAIIAPSTDARNPFGILISGSKLIAEAGTAEDEVHLGRAWDEGQGDLDKYAKNVATGIYPNGQALIRDSTLEAHVRLVDPWDKAATTGRPYSSTAGMYPANRLYEYGNKGPGSGAP